MSEDELRSSMMQQIEELLQTYSQDIDETDELHRSKIEIINDIVNKKQDWDRTIPLLIDEKDTPNILPVLLYEYATSIEKLTNGKVNYIEVIDKLSDLMGKLRLGEWKESDSNVKYDSISVTDPKYRKNEGKNFSAQACEYFDDDKLQKALILYDEKEGTGINLKDLNDIRHTLFHEWTHVMEMDKVVDARQEKQVSINGRVFQNNELKANGEVWGTGLVTREYGANAERYARGVDNNGNKRIMHNQITEGVVELIAIKVMENVLGQNQAHQVMDMSRYLPHTKVAQTMINVIGEEQFISMFVTHSQELINMLESKTIEDRDALHYMSDFINDQSRSGLVPKYSPKTNLQVRVPPKMARLFPILSRNWGRIQSEFEANRDGLQQTIEKYTGTSLSNEEINKLMQFRQEYGKVQQYERGFYDTLETRLQQARIDENTTTRTSGDNEKVAKQNQRNLLGSIQLNTEAELNAEERLSKDITELREINNGERNDNE